MTPMSLSPRLLFTCFPVVHQATCLTKTPRPDDRIRPAARDVWCALLPSRLGPTLPAGGAPCHMPGLNICCPALRQSAIPAGAARRAYYVELAACRCRRHAGCWLIPSEYSGDAARADACADPVAA